MAQTVCYENCAVICPNESRRYLLSGLYDSDGQIIGESLFYRAPPPAAAVNGKATPRDRSAVTRRLDGEFLFGGYVFDHFGHCLMETFSRLPAVHEAACQVLFIGEPGMDYKLFWSLADLMGLDRKQIVILTESAVVSRLIVTPAGFIIRRFISEETVRAFERVGAARCPQRENASVRPLYVSRSNTRRQQALLFRRKGH